MRWRLNLERWWRIAFYTFPKLSKTQTINKIKRHMAIGRYIRVISSGASSHHTVCYRETNVRPVHSIHMTRFQLPHTHQMAHAYPKPMGLRIKLLPVDPGTRCHSRASQVGAQPLEKTMARVLYLECSAKGGSGAHRRLSPPCNITLPSQYSGLMPRESHRIS
jgi:hypothetical protein